MFNNFLLPRSAWNACESVDAPQTTLWHSAYASVRPESGLRSESRLRFCCRVRQRAKAQCPRDAPDEPQSDEIRQFGQWITLDFAQFNRSGNSHRQRPGSSNRRAVR